MLLVIDVKALLENIKAAPYEEIVVAAPHTGTVTFAGIETGAHVTGISGAFDEKPGTLLAKLTRENNDKPLFANAKGVVGVVHRELEGRFVEAGTPLVVIRHYLSKDEVIANILQRVLYLFPARPERGPGRASCGRVSGRPDRPYPGRGQPGTHGLGGKGVVMGEYIQIRVIAQTFDQEAAEKRFPKLYTLAWPVEATPGDSHRGLIELAATLDDRVRLGDLPAPERKALTPGVEKVMAAKAALEGALGERDAKAADQASYKLEDALAELEKLAPRP